MLVNGIHARGKQLFTCEDRLKIGCYTVLSQQNAANLCCDFDNLSNLMLTQINMQPAAVEILTTDPILI